VTKTFPPDRVREAVSWGQRCWGELRSELLSKREALAEELCGGTSSGLQLNKVRPADWVTMDRR
jgi:uncharacterized pyridoxal phosphate-containing UPF0001 family protein